MDSVFYTARRIATVFKKTVLDIMNGQVDQAFENCGCGICNVTIGRPAEDN